MDDLDKIETSQAIGLGLILQTARRHLLWVLPTGFVLCALVFLLLHDWKVDRYQASHWVEIAPNHVAFSDVRARGGSDAKGEEALLKSPMVLESVLAQPFIKELKPTTDGGPRNLAYLVENVALTSKGAQGRYAISFIDNDPVAAKQLSDAIAESFMAVRTLLDSTQISNVRESLRPAISEWESTVLNQQERLQLAARSAGIPLDEMTQQREFLASLKRAHMDATMQLKAVQQELSSLPDADLSDSEGVRVAELEDGEATDLTRLRAGLVAEKHRIIVEDSENVFKEGLVRIEAKIRDIDEQLSLRKAQASSEAEAVLRDKAGKAAKQQIADLELRIKTLNDGINAEKARLAGEQSKWNAIQFELDNVEVSKDVLISLRRREAALKTEGGYKDVVSSLASASLPETPLENSNTKRQLLAYPLVFAALFGLGLTVEVFSQRFSRARNVTEITQLSLLGELAKFPRWGSKSGRQFYERSVMALALRLGCLKVLSAGKVVGVVSGVSGEGKSTVTFGLACMLGHSKHLKVLVIDADVRKPSLHSLFDVSNEVGLVDVLMQRSELDDAIVAVGKLDFLPAGRLSAPPFGIFSEGNVSGFIDSLREHYDLILVDTSPLNLTPETMLVAESFDHAIVSFMRDKSRAAYAAKMLDKLELLDSNVVGAVFSGTPIREYKYQYGSYYYYGGKKAIEMPVSKDACSGIGSVPL